MWDVITTDRFDEWFDSMNDKEYQLHLDNLEAG